MPIDAFTTTHWRIHSGNFETMKFREVRTVMSVQHFPQDLPVYDTNPGVADTRMYPNSYELYSLHKLGYTEPEVLLMSG